MAYSEVSNKSWLRRMSESLTGIFVGFFVIMIATCALWWNEGRSFKTAGAIVEAELATQEVSDISSLKPELEGKVIYAVGRAETENVILKDDIFGVEIHDALNLIRKVEYYQFEEHSHSKTHTHTGGSSTTAKTYTYEANWVSEPVDSKSFRNTEYRERNITLAKIENKTFRAPEVKFGAYVLPDFLKDSIGGSVEMNVSPDTEQLKGMISSDDPAKLIHSLGNITYIGEDPEHPKIGDVRITFLQTPQAEISIVAQVIRNTFEEFRSSNGYTFSRLSMGRVERSKMFEGARSENDTTTLGIRIIGTIAVAVALKTMLEPLEAAASVIPVLGSFVGILLWILAFLIAFVWSFLVITLAWTRFRIFITGGFIIAAAVLLYFFLVKLRGKRRKVFTKNQYSVESLYEAVKNHKFTAGTPELVTIAYASIIVFPEIDRNNQIWIENCRWIKWYKKDQCRKWLVHAADPMGGGKFMKNMALDEVTGGLSSLSGYFGKAVNEAEKLVETTAQELDALAL